MKTVFAVILSLAGLLVAHADASRPLIRVALSPVIVDTMSGVAWKAMTAECTHIWAREAIEVTWLTPGSSCSGSTK